MAVVNKSVRMIVMTQDRIQPLPDMHHLNEHRAHVPVSLAVSRMKCRMQDKNVH